MTVHALQDTTNGFKMRKINKKASIFALGMLVVLLLALSRIYFLSITRSKELSGEFSIGENQLSFFASMQEAEKSILYGEEGFGLALHQSLHEITSSGGFKTAPLCGKSGSYTIWRKDNNTECYPSIQDFKQSLAAALSENMKGHFENNPYTDGGYEGEHELFFEQEDDLLVAKAYALLPSVQDIRCNYAYSPESGGDCGNYYYRPSFRKSIKFSLNDFNEIAQTAKKIAEDVESCTGILNLCVNSIITKVNSESRFNWGLCEVTGLFTEDFPVCVGTGKKALLYDYSKGEMLLEEATIKFVLSFP